jgi:DNA-binding CsgD family transcriptional regulator/PAS domain-containing protein
MSLILESADLARVQRVVQTLLSPLEHPHLDDWRRAVCREARDLLGADLATFQLPNPEAALFFSEELAPEVIGAYPTSVESLDRRFHMWKRKVTLGVCSRAMLWGSHLEEYERDAYYHEFVVPTRGFDAIIVASALDPQRIDAGTVATLMFHHDRPTGPRFGERGLALLRLLQPAFQAGVRSYVRLAGCRMGVGRLLDTMADGLVLFDADGRVVHENVALGRILADEPGANRDRVRGQMEVLARCMCALARGTGPSAECPPMPPGVREVRTATSAYRMHATLVDETLLGRTRGVLVALERTRPEFPTAEALRERFGLTAKEAEVALLLSRGHGNEEIARTLFVSPHTARRHTERILEKMKVRSRSEVAAKLLW